MSMTAFVLRVRHVQEDCIFELCSRLIQEDLLRVDAGKNVMKGAVAWIVAKPQGSCHLGNNPTIDHDPMACPACVNRPKPGLQAS